MSDIFYTVVEFVVFGIFNCLRCKLIDTPRGRQYEPDHVDINYVC